jgi:hypothetical protein
MKVTVIGNGISRSPIPLYKIPGLTIGCNELYRSFDPKYICAVDFAILKELHESTYAGAVCYRFKSLHEQGLKPKKNWFAPEFMDNHSSGNAAIELAVALDATQIDILGFDCQLGRIYGEHKPPSDWSKWIQSLIRMSKKYPIRRVVGMNSLIIPEIENTITVDDYIKEITL